MEVQPGAPSKGWSAGWRTSPEHMDHNVHGSVADEESSPGLAGSERAPAVRLGGCRRAGHEIVEEWLAMMPPTVVTLLPLEAVLQLLPGAVAKRYLLQQHAVCSELVLGGIQRLVGSGGGEPGSLLLPPLQLLVDPAGLLGAAVSDPLLHLFPAERNGPCHLGPLRGSPGGCVGGLVALDANVVGYPVESHPPPLCGETLQAAQDGGDKVHVVVGMALLEDLQHCPGGSVQHHGGLLVFLFIIEKKRS